MDTWERISALVQIAQSNWRANQMHLEMTLADNQDLREQILELKHQLDDALNRNSVLAVERDELATWISKHQREQGKIREAVVDQGQGS